MKTRMKPIVAIACLAGFIALPVFAQSNDAQMQKLENEIAALRQEIAAMKNNQTNGNGAGNTPSRKQKIKRSVKVVAGDHTQLLKNQVPGSDDLPTTAAQVKQQEIDIDRMAAEERNYLPFDIDVPGQAFVSTGPYIGVPITYDGSNLIINSPSVNMDLQLLNIRKSIHEQLVAMGGEIFKEPYHSHLLLSGVVEGDINYTDIGGSPSTSTIDVTNVSLDAFFIGPSRWTLGFIEFSFDNGPPPGSSYTVGNSHVFVNKAFITIGDLTQSPFYGTLGQFYVPFGRYSSLMVSDPLTKLLTRTKARAILVGMQQPGDHAFYGSTYIFRGDSHAASVSKINNGGINIGYVFPGEWVHGDIGAGIIGNIADSGGMQNGNGFASYEQLSHRVPGYNLRAILGIGKFDFIGEYVGASTSFNQNDMSFNGHGAKPSAIDLEVGYSFMILDNKPSTIAIGYNKSTEALSLGMPLTRSFLVLNTSIWRNTLQSLEFRYDRNYAASDTANGPTGAATTPGQCTATACTATGKADKAVTAQFDYYF